MSSKVLLLVLGMFYISISDAAEWSVKPLLNPSIGYDDNVLLSSSNKEGSFKLSAKPTIELGYEEADRNIDVNLGYSIAKYDQLSRFDQENPFLELKASKRTELSSWVVELGYSETSSRNTAIENTGNFSSLSIVTTESISPSYHYNFSERDTLGISLTYTLREYSTNEFSDNDNKAISASWQHQFTERFSSSVNLSYSLYESGTSFTGSKNNTYNLSIGSSYLISERWNIQGQIGLRQLDSERYISGFKANSSTNGSSFNVSANYIGDLNTLHFSGAQSLNPSSSGDVNEQLIFSASWQRSLSETLNFTIGASYRENVSASEISSNKRENISFQSSIVKNVSERLDLSFNYEYREQKITSEKAARGNSVSLTFNYRFDSYQVSR